MATLVHDDVLDDAPLRRGRPTVVADVRAATGPRPPATCSSRAPSRCSPRPATAHAVALLSETAVALAQGELAQRHDAFDLTVDRGALPAPLPAEDGAPLRVRLPDGPLRRERANGHGPPGAEDEGAELRAFGSEIGLAFQLLDDVLDVAGPPERTGKARGTDLLDGTVTLPLILAAERDPRASRGSTCAASTRRARRRSASGSRPPARWSRCAPRRWRWSPRRSGGLGGPAFDAEQRRAARPRRRRRRRALPAGLGSRGGAEVLGADQVGRRARRRRCRRRAPCCCARAPSGSRPARGCRSRAARRSRRSRARRGRRRRATRTRGSAARSASAALAAGLLPAGRLDEMRAALGADDAARCGSRLWLSPAFITRERSSLRGAELNPQNSGVRRKGPTTR